MEKEQEKKKERKKEVLAQNERLNKKFGNVTKLKEALLKKRCAVFQVFFLFLFFCFFTFVDFLYFMYTEREKKSIFGYCNWQACTVVYATVKYLLYHLYIAKTTQQIEKYTNK